MELINIHINISIYIKRRSIKQVINLNLQLGLEWGLLKLNYSIKCIIQLIDFKVLIKMVEFMDKIQYGQEKILIK